MALEHLAALGEITQNNLAAGTIEDLAIGYRTHGWKADDAVIRALSWIEKSGDFEAVSTAIRSVYLPWVEESARYLQQVIDGTSYPGGTISLAKPVPCKDGECVLFVDGLRFDAAKRLEELVDRCGFEVVERPTWAPLPSVTALEGGGFLPFALFPDIFFDPLSQFLPDGCSPLHCPVVSCESVRIS